MLSFSAAFDEQAVRQHLPRQGSAALQPDVHNCRESRPLRSQRGLRGRTRSTSVDMGKGGWSAGVDADPADSLLSQVSH